MTRLPIRDVKASLTKDVPRGYREGVVIRAIYRVPRADRIPEYLGIPGEDRGVVRPIARSGPGAAGGVDDLP